MNSENFVQNLLIYVCAFSCSINELKHIGKFYKILQNCNYTFCHAYDKSHLIKNYLQI